MSDLELDWNEDESLDISIHEDEVDERDLELVRLVKINPTQQSDMEYKL